MTRSEWLDEILAEQVAAAERELVAA